MEKEASSLLLARNSFLKARNRSATVLSSSGFNTLFFCEFACLFLQLWTQDLHHWINTNSHVHTAAKGNVVQGIRTKTGQLIPCEDRGEIQGILIVVIEGRKFTAALFSCFSFLGTRNIRRKLL